MMIMNLLNEYSIRTFDIILKKIPPANLKNSVLLKFWNFVME